MLASQVEGPSAYQEDGGGDPGSIADADADLACRWIEDGLGNGSGS